MSEGSLATGGLGTLHKIHRQTNTQRLGTSPQAVWAHTCIELWGCGLQRTLLHM